MRWQPTGWLAKRVPCLYLELEHVAVGDGGLTSVDSVR